QAQNLPPHPPFAHPLTPRPRAPVGHARGHPRLFPYRGACDPPSRGFGASPCPPLAAARVPSCSASSPRSSPTSPPAPKPASSGRRFAALARYLMFGRSGDEPERVAWTAGRNLGTDDPEVAAALMQATANANLQVEFPVYHLTINFDPADPVTPERMQTVANR